MTVITPEAAIGGDFIRRNRVDERAAAAVAVIAGLVALASGASPTGSAVVDAVLVAAAAGAVTWASASAAWWALAGSAGVSASIAFDPLVTAVGIGALLAGLWIGVRRQHLSVVRVVVGGVVVNVLLRSEFDEPFALSAVVGICTAALLAWSGVSRRPSRLRRRARLAALAGAGFVVAVLLVTATAAVSARADLQRGTAAARAGVRALETGDYARGSALFAEAATALRASGSALQGPLVASSRLVPVVAQNVEAGRRLAADAATVAERLAVAVGAVDRADLRVVDGAIDLDAIEGLAEPLASIQVALGELQATTSDVASPWLVGRVQDEVVELDAELDQVAEPLQHSIDAVSVAPAMLGADGPRRYLVLFTSPAEVRGLGGFIGNFAEVVADDGQVVMERFGRREELEAVIAADGAVCEPCSSEFVTRYGRFGIAEGPDRVAGDRVWSNLTMASHFPYVAEAAAALYPQSGGRPVDGVIVIDPYVVEALMKYTGPVEVPELGSVVQPAGAAEFILEEQYLLAGDDGRADRIEALDTLGRGVIEALFAGALPEPATLARDLGPLVEERRLLTWAARPQEREVFAAIGMLGELPSLDEADGGFAVTVTNGGASKIDVFLDRQVEVEVVDDGGDRRLEATVRLRNGAPASGLPDYVIGNEIGLPTGTSRLLVTFYGPGTLLGAARDGEPLALEPLPEAGWMAFGTEVSLPAGGVVEFRLEFDLSTVSSGDGEGPTTWSQPLAVR